MLLTVSLGKTGGLGGNAPVAGTSPHPRSRGGYVQATSERLAPGFPLLGAVGKMEGAVCLPGPSHWFPARAHCRWRNPSRQVGRDKE